MGTDIHGVFQRHNGAGWEDIESNYEQNRHYQLFAVLAGVRNGYGFAGVPTGEAVTPIAECRGLPDDFVMSDDDHPLTSLQHKDPRRRQWHEDGEPLTQWMGDHSHSWLEGAEMLAWAESAPAVLKVGILSRKEYADWDGKSSPHGYCGGISGLGVVVVNDNEVEKAERPDWTHIRCNWSVGLKSELGYFFDEVARLVAEHGRIRFVFGFDS